MSTPVVHLAGLALAQAHEEGALLRQRCAWCGVVLLDAILDPADIEDTRFTAGQLVEVDNPDGDAGTYLGLTTTHVPDSACVRMPREMTR